MLHGLCLILSLCFAFNISSQSCTYTVTHTNDVDPFTAVSGGLRWAIWGANSTPGSKICFNIPGAPPYIIQLSASLPPLIQHVIIDGTTQPGYSANQDPVVIIDGNNLPITIFDVTPPDPLIPLINISATEIKGLLLRNTADSGSVGISVRANGTKITNNMFHKIGPTNSTFSIPILIHGNGAKIKGNIIGTDINGTNNSNFKNYGGIYLWGIDIYRPQNCIIGGSGTNERNIIAFSTFYYAIVVENCEYNRISRNHIYNNPFAINLTLGSSTIQGNLGKPAPVITSAKASLSGIVSVKGTASPNDVIELFGSTGFQNANQYLKTISANGAGNWSTTLTSVSWPNLTATATDSTGKNSPNLENTSQLSNSLPISPCCTAVPNLKISKFYVGTGNW